MEIKLTENIYWQFLPPHLRVLCNLFSPIEVKHWKLSAFCLSMSDLVDLLESVKQYRHVYPKISKRVE